MKNKGTTLRIDGFKERQEYLCTYFNDLQCSKTFFFSQPSCVLTQASPGDLQSFEMNGILLSQDASYTNTKQLIFDINIRLDCTQRTF